MFLSRVGIRTCFATPTCSNVTVLRICSTTGMSSVDTALGLRSWNEQRRYRFPGGDRDQGGYPGTLAGMRQRLHPKPGPQGEYCGVFQKDKSAGQDLRSMVRQESYRARCSIPKRSRYAHRFHYERERREAIHGTRNRLEITRSL